MGMNLQLMPAHATPRMGQGVGTPFALNQEGKPPLETSISNLSLVRRVGRVWEWRLQMMAQAESTTSRKRRCSML